ncbi:MAG TPA: hypothetical protein VLI04_19405 [Nocardioidaceae bacterium]|nr:hypothetical protein [Nocardioidaceae bacterium]
MKLRRTGLASARTPSGEEVIGTRDALVVPGRTIPWEQVLRADWDADVDTLTVMLVDPEVLVYELDEPGLLLQLVRERVMASIVLTRRVPVTSELGFTVMARRPPAGGDVTLTFEYDRDLDPDDSGVQEAARAALRSVREELGIGFSS